MSGNKLKREHYRLSRLDLNEMNMVLQKIGIRLDQVDQVGQHHDAKGKKIVNVADGVNSDDAAAYGQISPAVSSGVSSRTTYFRHFLLMGG